VARVGRGATGAAADQVLGAGLPDSGGGRRLRVAASKLDSAPGGGHPSVALEVQNRGDRLVPVVTLRGLSTPGAAGLLAAGTQVALRFDAGPRIDLACGLDAGAIVCAPDTASIAVATALLATHSVEVQFQLRLQGLFTLPVQGGSLELQGTREALARFRAGRPAGETRPAEPGLDWAGFLDRVLRAAGFETGVAGLLARVAGG
jgi:hypothetical protein